MSERRSIERFYDDVSAFKNKVKLSCLVAPDFVNKEIKKL